MLGSNASVEIHATLSRYEYDGRTTSFGVDVNDVAYDALRGCFYVVSVFHFTLNPSNTILLVIPVGRTYVIGVST
jgi:hypothetical protein